MRKTLLATVALCAMLQSPSYAYSLYTMGIDNYTNNGSTCGSGALAADFPYNWVKGDGTATGNKAVAKGWTWQWNDTDTGCYNYSFVNTATGLPYVTQVDMFYFGGHSSENGPHLGRGANRDYSNVGCSLVMEPHQYKWSKYTYGTTSGNSKLKWFLNRACLMMFYSSDASPFHLGSYPLDRYYGAFDDAASGYPKGSLHSIFGSVADTYMGPFSVGNDFFDRTMPSSNAENAGPGWLDAEYYQAYYNPAFYSWSYYAKGIKVGLLSTYVYSGSTTIRNYYNEDMRAPYSDPSDQWYNTPYYTGINFYKIEAGTPKYHDTVI